jgi:hypothetical protein
VQNGTRVLIFKGSPVNELVAEGEVHGFFIQPREWAESARDGLPPSLANADFLLPLGMLIKRGSETSRISLEGVRKALEDESFPRSADEWRALDNEIYRRLIHEWP